MCDNTLEFVLFCSAEEKSKNCLCWKTRMQTNSSLYWGETSHALCKCCRYQWGSQKNSVNWKDIDLAKTVNVHASFRLGDEPDELRVCLMVSKVSDGGNISLGLDE